MRDRSGRGSLGWLPHARAMSVSVTTHVHAHMLALTQTHLFQTTTRRARCQVCVQPLAGNSLQSKLPQAQVRARAQRPQAVGSGSAGPTPCEHDAAAQRDSSGGGHVASAITPPRQHCQSLIHVVSARRETASPPSHAVSRLLTPSHAVSRLPSRLPSRLLTPSLTPSLR